MSKIIQLPISPTMVNYTNVLTSAPNEIYISKTESPESLASLIKNTITFQFSLTPFEEKKVEKNESQATTSIEF